MKTEQTKRKYGDWQTLGEMLDISSDAAKMRFLRGDKKAAAAYEAILNSRKELIKKFKKATA